MALVQRELKNAYIGEYGWQPWANTIWYWKLEDNTDAIVWTTESSNNVTFTTLSSWKKVWVFNGSSSRMVMSALPTWTNNTYLCRVKKNWSWTREQQIWMFCWGSGKKWIAFRTNTSPRQYLNSSFGAWVSIPWATSNDTWYLIVVVNNWSWSIAYLNWVQVASDSQTWANSNPKSSIWANSYSVADYFNGNVSEAIVEDRAWTPEEIADYYNITKWNYGL